MRTKGWFTALLMAALPSVLVAVGNPAQADNSRGFSEIAGCLSRGDHLLVSIVVDESASLQQTDPQAERVKGIEAAVDSLQQLAQLSPHLDVQVDLSTFARGYEQIVPWRQLTPASANEFRDAATAQLPQRNNGDATDYRQALLGSKKQLDSRAASFGEARVCKATLLFTDGALDVDAETSTAKTQLCQPGGIIDSVRQDDIAVIALALFTPGAGVTQAQRDFLQAMAEGRGASTTCGTAPIAPGDSQGVYLPASDPAALQFLFARSGAQVAGGSPDGQIACPSAACPSGVYTLRVDPGVVGTRVIVRTSGTLQMRDPTGRTVPLAQSPQTADGGQVSALQRGALTTINLTFSKMTAQPGRWSITTHGNTLIQTYWFWGASVRPVTHSITAGKLNKVQLQFVDEQGQPLPPQTYGSLTPVLVVGGRPVKAHVDKNGLITARYPLGMKQVASSVLLSATLSALTAPSHHRLGPIHSTANLAVALPPAFPRVAPTTLDFGHLTGTGAMSVPVTITGSELGATQVCLKSSSVSVPGGPKAANAISTGHRCLQIPAKESRKLVLRISPSTSADGVARGSVVLALRSSDGRTIQTSLPASLQMSRAIDKGKRWEIVALLLVAAILIPLLLLIGSNYWLLGRFSMASGTRTVRRPVLVSPSGLRSVDRAPLLLDSSELRNVAISGVQRGARIPVPNAPVSLTTRRVLSLRAPEGIAISTTGSRIISGTVPHLFTSPKYEAPVSLGRLDAVFLTFSPGQATDDEVRAELFVVIPPGIDLSDAQARIDSLSRRVDWGVLLKEQALNADTAAVPEDSAQAPAPGTVTEVDRSADPVDEPLHQPSWLDETESSSQTRTVEHQRRVRRRAQSGRSPAPSPTTPPSAPTDDDRPPLPDFLRDED